jgi:hypothetical protein
LDEYEIEDIDEDELNDFAIERLKYNHSAELDKIQMEVDCILYRKAQISQYIVNVKNEIQTMDIENAKL